MNDAKRLLVLGLVMALVSCASGGPADLECGEQRCDASLEQHPGSADWYIVISSECGVVTTTRGQHLYMCGYERWVGDGSVALKPGSCRVCSHPDPRSACAENGSMPCYHLPPERRPF